MAERNVTVRIGIQATSNLPQVAGAANAQVARLQQTTKGAAAAAAQLANAQRAGGTAGISVSAGAASAASADAFAASRFAERIERATRAAGLVGAAGLASMYGGINSVSPEAGSQVRNSFAMIGNELGIATIPAAVRFTGVLQGLSRGIRNVNEATGGWAGNIAFAGAATLTGVGALGMGANMVRTAAQGLGSLGSAIGIGAGSTGTAAVASAGAYALPVAAVAAVAGAVVDSISSSRAYTRMEEAGYRPPPGREENYAVLRGITRVPSAGIGAQFAQSMLNREQGARGLPTQGFGAWLAENLGLGVPGPGQQGGIDDLTGREPRIYQSPEELYTSMLLRSTGTPPAIAEQEQRANEALITALGTLTTAIQGTSGDAAWGPPASDNG